MTERPVHAATVVLARDGEAGVELFMVKRHSRSGFMASAYVYPGGKLDAQDATEATARHFRGVGVEGASALFTPPGERMEDDAALTPEEALGLYVAAIREVFEEAGLVLARRASDGAVLALDDAATRSRFEAHRASLNAGELSMTALAAAEGLVFQLDDLHYFAHWITPVVELRRFNTRFFIARAPRGQAALHDSRETVESRWLRPGEALELALRGEIQLAPPTQCTLEDMSGFESVDALIAGMCQRPVVPIMPRFDQIDGKLTLLLPGDPLYPSAWPVSRPTRVQFADGRWWSRQAP